jgi:hypothetical protein
MNTAPPQRTAPRPIKGSWEDIFGQAQQLARNYNNEAIPLYRRVFNGLKALPPTARSAGDNRLYNLMMTSGIELQGYFNLLDRYDESLEVIDEMIGIVAEIDKPQLIELKSDVLLQADRGEEAVAILRQLAASEDADIRDWGHIVAAYIRLKQAPQAIALLDEMSAWVDEKATKSVLSESQIIDAGYYRQRLHAAALLEENKFEEAEAIFDVIFATGGPTAFSPHLLYTRLVKEGRFDEAMRYIELDKERPVRAAFWRGLVAKYSGDLRKATSSWQGAITEESARRDSESIVEHILARYYLGDPEGVGVELMLRTQREQSRITWMIFMLTGLGWIVRGDSNAAHSNLRLALAQVKSMGEGKHLSNQYWRFLKDLAPADQIQSYAGYFETETDRIPETAKSVSALAQGGKTE